MTNFFSDADIIFRYSRKQALEDGVLVDISGLTQEAGIRFPAAVTQGLFAVLNDTSVPGQDFKGRVWDMLMVFRMHAKTAKGDEIHFAPFFLVKGKLRPERVPLWAKCGPGDDMEPCITFMLEGED